MNPNIKVFLVDDHEIFRNGLKQLVDSEPDMEVVGEAGDGETALETLRSLQPDIIIMDIRMPGINGVETSQLLLKREPQARIVFFSLYDNPDYVARALEMGASGYILKDTSNKIFLTAIRTVYNGKFYFIGDVTDVLVKKYIDLQKERNTRSSSAGEVTLSKREEQILRLINNSLSNKEIAESLLVSVRTIEAHRLNILRKFQANNIEEVLARLDSNLARVDSNLARQDSNPVRQDSNPVRQDSNPVRQDSNPVRLDPNIDPLLVEGPGEQPV